MADESDGIMALDNPKHHADQRNDRKYTSNVWTLNADTFSAVASPVLAATKVLNTVELLQHIFLYLPCKDVLLAQRVARIWKGTIIGSLQLRRALCLDPHPNVPMIPRGVSINYTRGPILAIDAVQQLLGDRDFPISSLFDELLLPDQTTFLGPNAYSLEKDTILAKIDLARNASLKKLLLSPQPTRRIRISVYFHEWDTYGRHECDEKRPVFNAAGVTIADVVEALKSHFACNKNAQATRIAICVAPTI